MRRSRTSLRCTPSALRVSLLLAIAPAVVAAGSDAPTSAPTSSTQHVLFMGADLALDQGRRLLPIRDVQGSSLFVTSDEATLEVAMKPDLVLQITESLKLADTSVEVAALKAERAYTPEADPFLRFADAARVSAAMADTRDESNAAVNRAMASEGIAQAAVDASTPETRGQAMAVLGSTQAGVAAAQEAAANTERMLQSNVFDVGTQAARMGAEAGQELFDAIRISFEILPGRDLSKPFCALIAQIRERGSKPNEVRKWIYVKSLDAMARGESRKVTIFRGGLPPGYLLERCDVHVYDQGQEVATSLSRRRVELSDDDVLQYRIVEYIGANKGRTLPAVLVSRALPGDVLSRLGPAQMKPTYYVRVGRSGKVDAAFLDDAGRKPVEDPEVNGVLLALRFMPALKDGKPVVSLVPYRLDRIETP